MADDAPRGTGRCKLLKLTWNGDQIDAWEEVADPGPCEFDYNIWDTWVEWTCVQYVAGCNGECVKPPVLTDLKPEYLYCRCTAS
jgi:hypothetical protein